jgi:DNA-binding transcriptional LysR family regulator
MLNVNRLRILREVAAKGSFSAAAQSLSYTQSAISQQIAALEAEVGTLLIERRPRGLRLTPAGAALVEHADAIMVRLESAEAELASIAGVGGGRLRMASFPTAGATLMPLAVAAFSKRHPGVELTLAEDEPEQIAPRLRDGEFDVALLFRFPGVGAAFDGLQTTDLLEDPLFLALPGEHRLAGKRTLRLGDLAGEAWVQTSADSPCARHVVRSCHGAGFEPRVSFESDDYLTVQGLVAAGVGVALIPRLALSSVRDDIVVRELSPSSPVRRVLAATPRGAHVPRRPRCSRFCATSPRRSSASSSGPRRGPLEPPQPPSPSRRSRAGTPRGAAAGRLPRPRCACN